jgi:spore coat protein U-like protein
MNTRFKFILALIAGISTYTCLESPSWAGSLSGGTTTSTTSVAEDCTWGSTFAASATYPLTFSAYSPFANATTAIDGVINLDIRCVKGTTISNISLSSGDSYDTGADERRLRLGSTTNYLNYQLYKNLARNNPWGDGGGLNGTALGQVSNAAGINTPLTKSLSGETNNMSVYARILNGQNPAVGAYTDTVTVTVNY